MSGGFGLAGRSFGGGYFGLPNTPENLAFIQTQLEDPTRGVPGAGYCNGTSAIRSAAPIESSDPVHIVDCLSLGMVCGMEDGAATCVAPVSTGPSSSCAFSGASFNHPRAGVFGFKSDGTYTHGSTPGGTYTLVDGVLTFNDSSGPCVGAPGSYVVEFADDCNSFTPALTNDACELRAEAFDGYVMARQP
jgi:hypothetical protein